MQSLQKLALFAFITMALGTASERELQIVVCTVQEPQLSSVMHEHVTARPPLQLPFDLAQVLTSCKHHGKQARRKDLSKTLP